MREYLFMALIAAAVTYLLVPLVRRFAIRIGAVPEVRDRDVHTTPTPRLGGLAMYGGLVVGLLVASELTNTGKALTDAEGEPVMALIVAGGAHHGDRLPRRLVGHGPLHQARRPDRRRRACSSPSASA